MQIRGARREKLGEGFPGQWVKLFGSFFERPLENFPSQVFPFLRCELNGTKIQRLLFGVTIFGVTIFGIMRGVGAQRRMRPHGSYRFPGENTSRMAR